PMHTSKKQPQDARSWICCATKPNWTGRFSPHPRCLFPASEPAHSASARIYFSRTSKAAASPSKITPSHSLTSWKTRHTLVSASLSDTELRATVQVDPTVYVASQMPLSKQQRLATERHVVD